MFEFVELLGRINSQVMRAILPGIREEGVKWLEMIILWKVYKKGACRTTDVAKDAGIPPSTFTGIVDRLESKSLVKRIYDPSDRRSVLIKGTPELQELMERIKAKYDVRLEEIFKDIPEDEFRHMMDVFRSLIGYMQHGQDCEKRP